jgi:uncharacterized protein YjaG (DUF416 family)
MSDQTTDGSVLQRIEELVSQEHRLQTQESMTENERDRLKAVQVELDQSWDLLRQRRALRAAGQDPDKAQVRPANIVEKYVE